METKLNIGCGDDIRKGWINLDIAKIQGVDVVHDINNLPLPFENESFDYVLCQDVLEHIEYIPLLKEFYRIMKTGGILEIRVPHFTSHFNFMDPTHKKRFSILTFDFFTLNPPFQRNYYFDFHFEKINYKKITFMKSIQFFWNYLIEPFVNSSRQIMNFYEASFLSRIFPAMNINIKLRK